MQSEFSFRKESNTGEEMGEGIRKRKRMEK
jgi:hypothetical protein